MTIYKKPHPHIVLMPDAGIYLHGNQCALDETHIRTAVLQADAVWVSVVGEGAPWPTGGLLPLRPLPP